MASRAICSARICQMGVGLAGRLDAVMAAFASGVANVCVIESSLPCIGAVAILAGIAGGDMGCGLAGHSAFARLQSSSVTGEAGRD